MKQFQESRTIRTLAQGAIAADLGGVMGSSGQDSSPCDVLQRLAQMIQRMRLEPTEAHIYHEVCETLVARATASSKWSYLPQALAQIMRLVEQRDYHWALIELRTISQPEWHSC
jgi:hypothetical protein